MIATLSNAIREYDNGYRAGRHDAILADAPSARAAGRDAYARGYRSGIRSIRPGHLSLTYRESAS